VSPETSEWCDVALDALEAAKATQARATVAAAPTRRFVPIGCEK
jgi:hypothetical protein